MTSPNPRINLSRILRCRNRAKIILWSSGLRPGPPEFQCWVSTWVVFCSDENRAQIIFWIFGSPPRSPEFQCWGSIFLFWSFCATDHKSCQHWHWGRGGLGEGGYKSYLSWYEGGPIYTKKIYKILAPWPQTEWPVPHLHFANDIPLKF